MSLESSGSLSRLELKGRQTRARMLVLSSSISLSRIRHHKCPKIHLKKNLPRGPLVGSQSEIKETDGRSAAPYMSGWMSPSFVTNRRMLPRASRTRKLPHRWAGLALT